MRLLLRQCARAQTRLIVHALVCSVLTYATSFFTVQDAFVLIFPRNGFAGASTITVAAGTDAMSNLDDAIDE